MIKNALKLTTAFILIVTSTISAQNFTFGLKGGASISNQKGSTPDNITTFGSSISWGGNGGIYGEYRLSKLFSVSVGAEYTSQWGLKENLVNNDYYLTQLKLDYVMIPVLARFSWKKSKRSPLKLYAALGPFAEMLLKAKPSLSQQPIESITDIEGDLNKLNAGVSGLLGISYNLNKKSALFIEGGGNYGFIPVQNGSLYGQKYTLAGVVNFGYSHTFQKKYRGRRR